jgi:hypothetical protein
MQLYDVRPGLSSQTTSAIEEIIVHDSMSLSFFDINAPHFEMANDNTWEEMARRVLQEHTELWERLAEL